MNYDGFIDRVDIRNKREQKIKNFEAHVVDLKLELIQLVAELPSDKFVSLRRYVDRNKGFIIVQRMANTTEEENRLVIYFDGHWGSNLRKLPTFSVREITKVFIQMRGEPEKYTYLVELTGLYNKLKEIKLWLVKSIDSSISPSRPILRPNFSSTLGSV